MSFREKGAEDTSTLAKPSRGVSVAAIIHDAL